jgi:hypothetical protein
MTRAIATTEISAIGGNRQPPKNRSDDKADEQVNTGPQPPPTTWKNSISHKRFVAMPMIKKVSSPQMLRLRSPALGCGPSNLSSRSLRRKRQAQYWDLRPARPGDEDLPPHSGWQLIFSDGKLPSGGRQ